MTNNTPIPFRLHSLLEKLEEFKKLSQIVSIIIMVSIFLLSALETSAQTYKIIGTETTTVADDLSRTVTTVQVGDNPINRFQITRVVKNISPGAIKGTLLLLPPLSHGFQNYEIGDNNDYNKSFAGFMARRNIDVWGYSQRIQGLTAGSCESGAVDCSVLKDWGLQTIVNDVAFVRQQIELAHPGQKPVVGGLSLGSAAGIATINAYPNDYAGAILIDGTLYDDDETVRALNSGFCAEYEQKLANGEYYDGFGFFLFKTVNRLAEIDPQGASPFFPGLTNHQGFIAFFSAPPTSALTPRPNYFFLAGNVLEDRFLFANESLVRANLAQAVDYATTRAVRDVNCGLAGERTFTNNLQNFKGKVIVFAGRHGFGTAMEDTAQLMTSANVRLNFNENYGHIDYAFSTNHLQEVEHSIYKWLDKSVWR